MAVAVVSVIFVGSSSFRNRGVICRFYMLSILILFYLFGVNFSFGFRLRFVAEVVQFCMVTIITMIIIIILMVIIIVIIMAHAIIVLITYKITIII